MQRKAYAVLAALMIGAALSAIYLSWTALGRQFDIHAYDFLFRLELPAPWQPHSIILAIDEKTLLKYGGLAGRRAALADGLEKISAARPAAVAVDLILADDPANPANIQLAKAFADTRNLVLSSDPLARWQRLGRSPRTVPQIRRRGGRGPFRSDKFDAVSRDLPLEKVAGNPEKGSFENGSDRRWALALATFLAVRGVDITESPDDLLAGTMQIPLSDRDHDGRLMRIRYTPQGMGGIPRVSVADLDQHPDLASKFAGKVVFAGETAQSSSDHWLTPYSASVPMPGIEVNANAYETIDRHMFLVDARLTEVVAVCFALAAATGLGFLFLTAWQANIAAVLVIGVSQAIPALEFSHNVVWPWMPGTLSAIFGTAAAAAWRHVIVRRQLLWAENEKERYQRSMQFAIHELRTPLTAIQGSSELISRYGAMPELKRKEMAELINAESKRLGRMIETFLSVEKLSAGQMEMKQDRFSLAGVVERCAVRARPIADAKAIAIDLRDLPSTEITGDRELMEYAVYNLLTNAIKYSPSGSRVRVFGEVGEDNGEAVRLSVEDQGIGMDKKEVGRIFEKFYRTKRAEQSGEVGTGIGLSIVEQIVLQHGGSIQVESEPGKGSRFTLVLKRA